MKRSSESGRIFEAAEGDDDGVVVAGGNARHGPLAVAGGELVFAGDEEIGVRIELEEFGGPLIDQVIGDDEHGLLSEAEPFEFHRGRHERERFPGSDDVADQGGIRLQNAPGGVLLVRRQFAVAEAVPAHTGEG